MEASSRSHSQVRVDISRPRLARALLAIAGVLALASALVQIPRYHLGEDLYTLVDLFDSAEEANIPTWFNALVLLACAAAAAVIAVVAVRARDVWARHWVGVALLLGFAATDEAAEIHEIGNLARRVTGDAGILSHPWVILGTFAVVAISVYFVEFIRSLPQPTRRRLVLAAGVYAGAALGLELVENAMSSAAGGRETFERSLVETGEELLETSAAIVLLDTLLGYAHAQLIEVKVRVAGPPLTAPEQAFAPNERGRAKSPIRC